MSTFFVGWDLWQEMTFCLACCIVLVFGIGLAKLWWTNREMRKLEIIDEEKRARVAEMRYCGIRHWGPNEIPFGVRALQTGVEVEGIWISNQDTLDVSQIASSATLVGEQLEPTNAKGKSVDRRYGEHPRTRRLSGSSLHDQISTISPPRAVTRSASKYMVGSTSDANDSIKTQAQASSLRAATYLPTGLQRSQRQTNTSSNTFQSRTSSAGSTKAATQDSPATGCSSRPAGDSILYGAAEVYANRRSRRPSHGFEILPAGTLGTRREFLDYSGDDEDDAAVERVRQSKTGYTKLRKVRPLDHDQFLQQDIR